MDGDPASDPASDRASDRASDPESDRASDRACELCEATPFTEWFHSDELCWIAECDSCAVPMVVWRRHDPMPPPEIRQALHDRLAAVMHDRRAGPFWIDDALRTIPDHYHAHARRRPDWSH